MISCNYNGWADVPEDEREELEVFEATRRLPATLADIRPLLSPPAVPERKAA